MAQHSMLVVADLHMSYKTAAGLVRAVRGVSFTVQPGEFYTFCGTQYPRQFGGVGRSHKKEHGDDTSWHRQIYLRTHPGLS